MHNERRSCTRNFESYDPYDPYHPYLCLNTRTPNDEEFDSSAAVGKDRKDGKDGVMQNSWT